MITVVGSINMDIVCQTNVFPKQGETILGERFETIPGGKGANQAVAAARLGAKVRMVGAVGQDSFGPALMQTLHNEGIETKHVAQVETNTGIANIILFEQDNRIIVVPGANFDVTPDMVAQLEDVLKNSKLVVLQLEIPIDTVQMTLNICEKFNVPVLLNPAPARNFIPEWMDKIAYLTPNETECALIFGEDVEQTLEKYPNKLIVTLGADGAMYHNGKQMIKVPGFKTTPIDTTGAGDTFNGAFAAKIVTGASVEEAVLYANAAGSLSVEQFGAQGGMPTANAVQQRLSK